MYSLSIVMNRSCCSLFQIDGIAHWSHQHKYTVISRPFPATILRTSKSPALKQIIMTNSTIPPDAILNPYTPLAFLPPDVANQYQIVCYVYVATLAVSSIKCRATAAYLIHFQAYTWDWLMSIPEEYRVIRKVGFTPPNVAYFVSRLAINYL
jgi:hypothetical protein